MGFFAAITVLGGCKKDPAIPDLKTTSVSAITTVSAVSGGEVISDGGSEVTARGVCWGTSTNPEVQDLTQLMVKVQEAIPAI